MDNENERIEDELLRLVEEKKFRELKSRLVEMNEVDIASFMEELDSEKTVVVFRMLPKELATDVFAELEPEQQQQIVTSITDYELGAIINDLYVDDAVDMLEELPANVVKRVLKNSNPEQRKLLNQFLKYPEDSAGSVMTAEFVNLKKNMTVADAFEYIRRHGVDKETIYTCYVTDDTRRLQGVVTVKDLLMSSYETKIDDIMDDNVIKVTTTEDQEEVANLFNEYNLLALPVVDNEERLVGIITVDDVMDFMEAEATEDIEKMAAIIPSEKPYMSMSPFEIWKNRIPWLLLLMVSATFTGMIISHFEDALQALVVLTAFIPMLMDTAGNSGSQASVTVIRGLSLNELDFSDIFQIIWKEVRVAVLCGLTLAAACFLKIYLVDNLLLHSFVGVDRKFLVIGVICITLSITVLFAKVVGCVLPLVAKKLGFDPAVMASPFITTIVDALSLLVYFGVARLFLHI